MHLFLIMYLIGLPLGIGFYAATYFLEKETSPSRRALFVILAGFFLASSSFVIGGFEGMPITLLSAGVLTIAGLTMALGKNPRLTRFVFSLIALLVVSVLPLSLLNKTDYWIINKEMSYGDNVEQYYNKLQTDPSITGYKPFVIAEGNSAIVLSLGEEMKGNKIEVRDVVEEGGKTIINIRSFESRSTEKNPAIIIGLDRLKSEIEIKDTDGTLYMKSPE